MSIEAAHSVIIRRPIAVVFVGLTRLDAWRAWRADTVGARQISAGSVGVGATFEQTVRAGARLVVLTGEVIAYEPPHTLAYRAIAGPLPLTCHYTVEVTVEGTRLAVRADSGDEGTDPTAAAAIAQTAPCELDALAALLHAEPAVDLINHILHEAVEFRGRPRRRAGAARSGPDLNASASPDVLGSVPCRPARPHEKKGARTRPLTRTRPPPT